MAKRPTSELLRLACCYAEAYLESAIVSNPDIEVGDDKELLQQIAAYRRKRWGLTEREKALANAENTPIQDVSGRPNSEGRFL
jgi:hypothetical protein